VLVLQNNSDPLHILPTSSSGRIATTGAVCTFSNIEVDGDVDVIEEIFIPLKE
jgi:hypothetical protein